MPHNNPIADSFPTKHIKLTSLVIVIKKIHEQTNVQRHQRVQNQIEQKWMLHIRLLDFDSGKMSSTPGIKTKLKTTK